LEFGFWNWILGFGIWDLGFGILEFWIWDLDFGIWILGFGFWDLDFGIWILEFGFWNLLRQMLSAKIEWQQHAGIADVQYIAIRAAHVNLNRETLCQLRFQQYLATNAAWR